MSDSSRNVSRKSSPSCGNRYCRLEPCGLSGPTARARNRARQVLIPCASPLFSYARVTESATVWHADKVSRSDKSRESDNTVFC